MLNLIANDTQENSVLRAEVFLEMGQFEECQKQLDEAVGAYPMLSVQIVDHACRRESKVFQMK
jgi:hypothetical protein